MTHESEPKREDVDDPNQDWQWKELERRLNSDNKGPFVPVRKTREETERVLDHLWP